MKGVLDALDNLIAFETVTAGPNGDIISYISDYMNAHGATVAQIDGSDEEKSGLVATFGPETEGGIVLSGHTDVVPVTGQNWTLPAFTLTRTEDRLYGRGTTDMKGFLACMLHAADLAADKTLNAPLKLVFSYDEEIGCVGIQEMAPNLADLLGAPRMCIVGEPTGMQVARGHKGKAAFKAICHGQAGHSALAPCFVNAIHLATDLVTALRDVQSRLETEGARDADYDVPYSTVHVGRITGGQALNIVPERTELLFEIRHLAEDDLPSLVAGIEAVANSITDGLDGAGRIALEEMTSYPGLDVSAQDAAVGLCQRFALTDGVTKVPFGTEAGVFQNLGIPTVVCGPGSMEGQGHKADEYIELSELSACAQMMDRVVSALQGKTAA